MEIYNFKETSPKNKNDRSNGTNDSSSVSAAFKVTAIKPAVRTENRVNIFIDDKFEFSLDITQVVDLKIKVGRSLSESDLAKCRKESEFGKLYSSTLEWILTRPHSIQETRDYLRRKRSKREIENRQASRNREKIKNETKDERAERKAREKKFHSHLKTKELPLFTDADIERIITRLLEKGYLNDVNFTKFYIENRFVKKGVSEKRLRQELVKKGISQDLIEQTLAENPRDASEEMQKIIQKKRAKYDDEKLIAYLVRQGFDYQQSKAAVLGTDSQS